MCSIYFLVLAILLPCCFEILILSCSTAMKETLRYLAGIAGPNGYGSKTTADQVVRSFSSSPHHHLTAIITGATSGIGAETARVLAKRGVRLVIPARDRKKAVALKEGIEKENPKVEIFLFDIDLSSLASVKRFCTQFLALGLPLNILINNAGIFSQNLEFSEDKIEMTFATNYIGHYLLTEMLLEKMVETAEQTGIHGRIINLSSVIHSWVKRECFTFTQMLNPNKYNATRAYAQSKLANILHAKEISRQLKARNAKVTINAVHPGIVKTGIIRAHKGFITDSLFFIASKLLKSTSQGASTSCYVALSPQAQELTGKYFADCNECSCSALSNDESEARRLWTHTRALIHRRLQYQITTPS
ncbi:short-chain dehydrogenase TIC 32 A, chloroplastic-like [Hibiscus syriacus]|uniref:short-chain dehydrogenase TIC 32 A, chloroplastic-like n=1 Tax=Hibiscus syriacus TaxID=106335 RepID=UPI001920AE3D|nr:short-chain dehydrogenase TIC 32 A, chloroplastic-like [Hibiscus syriacus]